MHGPRYASPMLLPILQDFDFNSHRLRYDTPSVPQTIFFKSTCEVVRFCRLEHLGHFTHSGMSFWLSIHCLPLRQLINLHDAVGRKKFVIKQEQQINFHLQARVQFCGCILQLLQLLKCARESNLHRNLFSSFPLFCIIHVLNYN